MLSLLRWQFDLTWSLLELHLDVLTDADYLWEPAGHCWTVRRRDDGTWVADFAEQEPDPVPAPTIGWLTWHMGWWWSGALAAVDGGQPKAPGEIAWPGDAAATARWLRGLRADWVAVLDRLTGDDLDAVATFPWQDGDHTVAHMVSWVNAELMKNTAEVGQLRLVRAASAVP